MEYVTTVVVFVDEKMEEMSTLGFWGADDLIEVASVLIGVDEDMTMTVVVPW